MESATKMNGKQSEVPEFMRAKWKTFREEYIKGAEPEFVFIVAVMLIVLCSHAYSDFYATWRHGITFWTALFDGHPLQFYEYCKIGGPGNAWGNSLYFGNAKCAYDFTIYGVFAIWNLPIWLIEKIFHVNAQEVLPCIIWAKLLMAVALLISAKYMLRICEQLYGGAVSRQRALLVYLSSVLFYIYTIATGNYDILGLAVMLWGISCYFEGHNKRFILAFALAFSMKFFGILIFIPLVLLREKRVLIIIRNVLLCLSVSVIEKILFTTGKVDNIGDTAGGSFVDLIEEVTVAGSVEGLGIGTVSLMFIGYAGVAIYCYMQIDRGEMCDRRKAIYMCLVSWALFFLLQRINSYWIIIIVPFMVLVLLGSRHKKMSYMLEGMFSLAMLFRLMLMQGGVLSGTTTFGMLPFQLFTVPLLGGKQFSGYMIGQILERVNEILPIEVYLSSVCVVCMVAFLYINRPSDKGSVDESAAREGIFVRNRLWINLAVAISTTVLYCAEVVLKFIVG